jgi:hypothetical protein
MKNSILTSLLLLVFNITFAQNKVIEKKEGWEDKGKFTFLFNQSAFSNWAEGGDNTLAGNISANYSFNFKKNNFIWNNKVVATYGMTKSANTEFPKKTNDGIAFNSLVGFDADNLWFYSFLVNFRTQFTKGYKYSKVDGIETRTEYTNFMSPGYLLVGPGMLWEKSSDFKINLAPATSKFIFVDKNMTLPNDAYFGVEEGKSLRYEIGFSASLYYKFIVMENITMENTLAFYSNYIDNPQNVDINYLLDIDMKINKYFSFDFLFQAIYDNVAYSGFQIREVFGLGINYSF